MLRRAARHASGWWPAQIALDDIAPSIDYIKSQPDYNGKLEDVFFALSTLRVGKGHVIQDDPAADAGHSKQEIIDSFGMLKGLGVTMSSVPTGHVTSIEEYMDFTQWVAEEIMLEIA